MVIEMPSITPSTRPGGMAWPPESRGPIVKDGFVEVPETPGLGVELNEEVVREHLREGEDLFAPTPEWDEQRSWDRIWS